MVTISLRVPVRCPACAGNLLPSCERCAGSRAIEELFSAWLAMPPGVTDGTILTPSAFEAKVSCGVQQAPIVGVDLLQRVFSGARKVHPIGG